MLEAARQNEFLRNIEVQESSERSPPKSEPHAVSKQFAFARIQLIQKIFCKGRRIFQFLLQFRPLIWISYINLNGSPSLAVGWSSGSSLVTWNPKEAFGGCRTFHRLFPNSLQLCQRNWNRFHSQPFCCRAKFTRLHCSTRGTGSEMLGWNAGRLINKIHPEIKPIRMPFFPAISRYSIKWKFVISKVADHLKSQRNSLLSCWRIS